LRRTVMQETVERHLRFQGRASHQQCGRTGSEDHTGIFASARGSMSVMEMFHSYLGQRRFGAVLIRATRTAKPIAARAVVLRILSVLMVTPEPNCRAFNGCFSPKNLQLLLGNHKLRDAAVQTNGNSWKHPHYWLVQSFDSRKMDSDFSSERFPLF